MTVAEVSPKVQHKGWRPLVGVFVVVVLATLVGGYAAYRQEAGEIRIETARELETVSALKVHEINNWRRGRQMDAAILAADAELTTPLSRFLSTPSDAVAADGLRARLRGYRNNAQYDQTLLITRSGMVVLAEPVSAAPPADAVLTEAARVMQTGRITLVDFFLDRRDQREYLALLIPVFDPANPSAPAGILAWRIDPRAVLYSFIETWPHANSPAEAFLVQRDGSDAVSVDNLRLDAGGPLSHRFPLTDTSRLGVQAALGWSGPSEGLDQRDRPAVGVLRPIPETPWFLVARMGTAEIRARLWSHLWAVMAFFAAVMFGAGTGLTLIWRGQVARHYRDQVILANSIRMQDIQLASERRQAEDALREREERLRLALVSASQGMWDLNVQTGEAIVSPEYATMLGYDAADFHETNAAWIGRLHPDDRERVAAYYNDYIADLSPVYQVEFRQRTQAGAWKWILSQGSLIERSADGRPLRMIGTHTDITSRKLAELTSEHLAQLYAALSECYEAVAESHSEAELFPRICEAVVQVEGLAMAWVGLTDEATGLVKSVASHGAGTEYLNGLEVSAYDNPFGRGPTGSAIREGRQYFNLDLLNDPRTAPWHERMRAYGWVASAALPLEQNGRAIGALTVYARSTDAFDEESRRLLCEIAAGVSYALDGLTREASRVRAENQLRESELRYRTLFADTNVPRLVLDTVDGRIVDANEAAARFYGWPLPTLLTKVIGDINTLGAGAVQAKIQEVAEKTNRTFEFRHRLANGQVRDVLVYSTHITLNGQGRLLSTVLDISDRKRDEMILLETLREKEALLKEVHHRVKNNLQVVSSLLRLESGRQADQAVKTVLNEMQFRILSMALLHETLYRSGNLARVDLAAYLRDLAVQLFRSAAPSSGTIELKLQLESVLLDIDHAIPCGLLVNELLSNCLKHAFPSGGPGSVTVSLGRVDDGRQLRLRVSDTGVGLPADFETRRTSSLGLALVTGLARQLQGTVHIAPGPGAQFSVVFMPNAIRPVEAA